MLSMDSDDLVMPQTRIAFYVLYAPGKVTAMRPVEESIQGEATDVGSSSLCSHLIYLVLQTALGFLGSLTCHWVNYWTRRLERTPDAAHGEEESTECFIHLGLSWCQLQYFVDA